MNRSNIAFHEPYPEAACSIIAGKFPPKAMTFPVFIGFGDVYKFGFSLRKNSL